jgi:hypothetical protein
MMDARRGESVCRRWGTHDGHGTAAAGAARGGEGGTGGEGGEDEEGAGEEKEESVITAVGGRELSV